VSYYAVLIGVSKTGRTKVRMPAAVPAITAMRAFLRSAHVPDSNLAFLAEASYQEVEDAVGPLAKQVTQDDTLLIMFVGHGVQGQGTDPDAWALRGMDVITDEVLSGWLARVPATARRIVISDCCYGLGIAHPGPGSNAFPGLCATLRYELARLRQRLFFDFFGRAQRFASAMTRRIRSVEPLAPMICLAAASAVDEVTNRDERLFLTLTLGIAAGGGKYDDLQLDFETVRTATSAFCVEANPRERLHEVVLAVAG
jgi:hypothetical protein